MRQVNSRLKRQFLIHGVLVLLPLVLLTVLAVSWLRQDRLIVWESAKEVARLSSNESARRIGERIKLLATQGESNALAGVVFFKVADDGRLISPKPRDLFPVPKRYPVEQLSFAEQMLWMKALAADSEGTVTVRSNAWSAFLSSAPKNDWRVLGQYHLAMALARENPDEASRLLKEVFTTPTEVQLDSGLPLLPLAEWRWMELNTNQVTSAVLKHFCSNAVAQASVLTQDFMAATTCRGGEPLYYWLNKYQHDEIARRLFLAGKELWASRSEIMSFMRLHWIQQDDSAWLAVCSSRGEEVVALRFEDMAELVKEELRRNQAELPTLVYEVKVAGKVLINPHYLGDVSKIDQISEAIITAITVDQSTAIASSADRVIEVKGFLQQNSVYRSQQNLRLFMFGSVITLAVLAALIGLVSAWRTFQQQWQLSEMKSNFVSSVSHELRAPLASVRLMAESLERGKVPEEEKQQEYFQLIGQECRRLTALIENVLDFARMDQGRKQYHMEPTDLIALVQHTIKSMEPYAGERGVMLTLSIQGAIQDAWLDGQAMQQALVNLIDNAVKYSPARGSVLVKLEYLPGQLELAVKDAGPGIPLDEQEKIFERFYRRGSELRRETQGVGIGLSIVKHVAEAHGGKVVVESHPGQGSTFRLIIPQTKS